MVKDQGRFLLTWNNQKHPEVAAFFNQVEKGMAAYRLRELITNYMKNKDTENDDHLAYNDGKDNSPVEKTPDSEQTSSEDYREFDPFNL